MQAAVAARDAGYEDIRTFLGGFPEWVGKGYPVAK
jgi:rhodanese-related sulfurtransferase